jgi:hypothetical protein
LAALITYLFAGLLALGYACGPALPQWRRAVAAGLALILTFTAGELLINPFDPAPAMHVLAGAAVLVFAGIVFAPRRQVRRAPVPIPRQARHAGPRRAAGPVITDPWAALYASLAVRVAKPPTQRDPHTRPQTYVRRRRPTEVPLSIKRVSRCTRR